MYACMYLYMYSCMYVFIYVCMHVFVYICMYACMCVYMYVCMYVFIYVCMYVSVITHPMSICVYACVSAYVNQKGGHNSKNDLLYDRASILNHTINHVCDSKRGGPSKEQNLKKKGPSKKTEKSFTN